MNANEEKNNHNENEISATYYNEDYIVLQVEIQQSNNITKNLR
jgi:hypothetical protein